MLDQLFRPDPPPFALLRREGHAHVDVLIGELRDVDTLAEIPLDEASEVLALVPYRQLTEIGADCHDDGTPLRCLLVRERTTLTIDDALALLPDVPVDATADGFDVDDETYAAIVKRVITDEIGRGEGANFVIRRDFHANLAGYSPATALTLFRRLLTQETGAYWTFVVHTGAETLVGATPERHVSAHGGTVVMNPISGTYRYPPGGPTVDGVLRFLDDVKEVEELYMVVDEELKMMSAVCADGGQVKGPYLKEMGHLAHTEYVLEGRSGLDVRDILRGTMFAATVTGSPVVNACRVISRYEPTGRGYYAGVLALIGRDDSGAQTLDAPILIRTLYIDPSGRVRLPVGATLVRHSRPADEVAETYAKAAGVLAALSVGAPAPPTPPTPPPSFGLLRVRNRFSALKSPKVGGVEGAPGWRGTSGSRPRSRTGTRRCPGSGWNRRHRRHGTTRAWPGGAPWSSTPRTGGPRCSRTSSAVSAWSWTARHGRPSRTRPGTTWWSPVPGRAIRAICPSRRWPRCGTSWPARWRPASPCSRSVSGTRSCVACSGWTWWRKTVRYKGRSARSTCSDGRSAPASTAPSPPAARTRCRPASRSAGTRPVRSTRSAANGSRGSSSTPSRSSARTA